MVSSILDRVYAGFKRGLSLSLCTMMMLQTFLFGPSIANAVGEPIINPITVTAGISKIANEVAGTVYTNDQRPTIAATFTQGTNPIDETTAILRVSTLSNPLVTTRDTSGISYTPNSSLPANTYAITVDVKDDMGTPAAQVSKTVVIDITAPEAPTISSPSSGTSNDNTPTIAGTAEANSTVKIYDSVTEVATTTADGSGNFSINTSALDEGIHTLTAKATDYAGNVSLASSAVDYTVDTTPPAAPILTPEADTSNRRPQLEWSVVPDAYLYHIQADDNANFSSPLFDYTTDATFLVPLNDLPNGTIYWRVSSFDNLYNESAFSAVDDFIVDSASPTVISVALSDPSPVRAGTLTVTVNFSEDLDTTLPPTVTFGAAYPFEDHTVIQSSYSGSTWTGTVDINNSTGDGTQTIKISGFTDSFGNPGNDDTSKTFVIDTTDPTINITAPTAGAVFVLADTVANLAWSAADATSGIATNSIDLAYSTNGIDYINIATDLANTGAYSWVLPAIDNSIITLRVQAYDNAGNVGAAVSDQFIIDRVAPDAPTGGIAPASPTNDNTLTVTGTVDNQTTNVQVSVGPNSLAVAPAANSYEAVFSPIPDGAYLITATAFDVHGNASPTTTIETAYQIDTSKPIFTPGAEFPTGTTNNSLTTIEGTFSDVGSGLNPSSLDLTLDGWYSIPVSSLNITGGHFIYTPEYPFEDGSYNVAVTISDNAGNTSDVTSWSFTVSSAPTITSVTPVGGTVVAGYINSTNTSITVEGTVPADSLGIQTVEIYLDGHSFSTPQTTLVNGVTSFSTSITGAQLAQLKSLQGGHTLSARRIGYSGNTTGLGNDVTVNVDTIIPDAPTVALSSPINSSNQTNVSLTIAGESNTTVSYSIDDDGVPATSPVTGAAAIDSLGNVIITGIDVSGLTDGNLTAAVTLSDAAGNTGASGTDTKLKDTVAPVLSSVSISSSHIDTTVAKVGDTVTLSITAGETITAPTVTIAGQPASVIGSGSSYSATYTMQSGDTEGTIPFEISGFSDVNGNLGVPVTSTTDLSSVLFDKTSPTVGSFSPYPTTNNTSTPISIAWSDSGSGFVSDPVRMMKINDIEVPTDWSGTTMTYTPAGPLGDGAYNVVATIKDRAGNSAITSWTFATDHIAPAVNITFPLAGDWVNGSAVISFTDDELTNPQCSIDNLNWLACTSGLTTLSDLTGFDALGDMPFTLYLKDTDPAGNTGTDDEVGIIKDTTAPAITVNSLVTTNLSGTSKVDDTITAVFTTDEILVVDPTVLFGGQPMIKDSQSGNQYTFRRVLDGWETEGTAVLEISVSDSVGNIRTDSSSSLATDFTAPVTSDNAPAGWVNSPITITLSVAETGSNPTTTLYSTDGSDPTITYTVPFIISGEGSHELRYKSTDSAGNEEVVKTKIINIDTKEPSILPSSSVIEDMNSDGLDDDFTNTKLVRIAWPTGSDSLSGVDHYLLRIKSGSTSGSNIIVDFNVGNVTSYILTSDQSSLLNENNIYFFAIAVVDAAGNKSNYRNSDGITIDLTAPVIMLSGSSPVTIERGNSYTDAGATWTDAVDGTGNAVATGTVDVNTVGVYTIHYNYTDQAGNPAIEVTRTVIVKDTIPPDAPVINAVVGIQGDSVDLSGTAEADSTVNLTLTNGASVNDSVIADGLGNWSKTVDITALSDGIVTVSATATDAAGNISGEAVPITFCKDSVAPSFTNIVANPANANAASVVTITFTASEELQADPTVTVGGNAASYVGKSGLDYTYSYAVGGLDTEGVKTISVSGVDIGGNPGTSTGSMIFDFTAPTASSGMANGSANPHRPTISAVITDTLSGVNAGTVVMRINGVAVNASFTAGVVSFTPTKDMPARTYTVTIDAKDNVGNTMTRYSFSFTVE
jgi:hypothetical protein